jgi:ATP-independent RNA helicase DbpA
MVVGTPGRILKHLSKGALSLDSVRAVVLDEADRMLDMGFHDDMTGILSATPSQPAFLGHVSRDHSRAECRVPK